MEPKAHVNHQYLDLLTKFVRTKGPLNHHIASFDHLIDVELKRILLNEANREIRSSVDPDFFIRYLDIWVTSPKECEGMGVQRVVTPQECRLRELTYKGDIFVNVEYTKREGNVKRITPANSIRIGSIPIMLRSKKCNLFGKSHDELVSMRECPLDPGGYFIVRGVERVCLVQEQQSKNRIIIECDDHGNILAQVQSKTHYSISKCSLAEKKGRFYLTHRSFTEEVPVVILLKALGMVSDQEIVEHIVATREAEQVLYASFEEAYSYKIYTQDEALAFIGRRRKETFDSDDVMRRMIHRSAADEAAEFLASVLLCHIREGEIRHDWNFRHKALYICHMLRLIIAALQDQRMLDEKDFYGNKRFETPGTLMGLLFEDVIRRYNRQIRTAADQHLSKKDATKDINLMMMMESKADVIDKTMTYTLSSGRWELKRFNLSRQGVTQVLSRQSYMATLGMLTRLASSFEKTRKMAGPRSLQPSHWGMVCPCDTPEGESCGLVKNFAILSQVTLDLDDGAVRRALYNLGMEELETLGPQAFLQHYSVFLNGALIGIHRYPAILCAGIRSLRRSGRLHPHVSVYCHPLHHCVNVSCDGGRIVRLYILVRGGVPCVTSRHLADLRANLRSIDDFLVDGLVEFVDVNEANDCLIAIRPTQIVPETTHLEIEPFSILGVSAGIIPFPHHNQSARNTFQSAMGKQALGAIGYNQQQRIDTVLISAVYPQRPLCRTQAMNLTDFEALGGGINAMVCVMSYSGYDIEDAQIYNRASLDRGYARCIVLRKHEAQLNWHEFQTENVMDIAQPPPRDQYRRNERFHALDEDGIVSKGVVVQPGDVLVNKFVPSRSAGGPIVFKSQPLLFRSPVSGVVDHVVVSPFGTERGVSIKIITRDVRTPEIGDKFSSRHGQKGVVGLIADSCDLPFNEQGQVPDVIMNPHGFPSRMTVGKLLELVSGKAAVLDGLFGDGTAFAGDNIEDITSTLVRHGYHYHGKDVFYSGISGEVMPGYVFFGPIYYQRLKHMVVDKMHSRSTGPKSLLTRQPTEGRARDGGLRIGEMERDCMVGYGAAMLLNERLLLSSDLFSADVCRRCGGLGYSRWCPNCKSTKDMAVVNMPYAFKLLLQEMQGMGISTRLVLKEDVD